jgi:4-hydroxythreonine-4-phosphate dehydrogenase
MTDKNGPGNRVFVTVGDPNGIGPEVLISALAHWPEGACPITIVGSRELLEQTGTRLSHCSEELQTVWDRCRCRLNADYEVVEVTGVPWTSRPGRWDDGNTAFLKTSLEQAILLAVKHHGALVTGPVDKRFFSALGMCEAGHTEFLAAFFNAPEPLMFFDSPELRVAVMTRHVPLAKVTSLVTQELLSRAVSLAARYLNAQSEYPNNIAVAGLDPHCGEWGGFGRTDLTVRDWISNLTVPGCPVAGPCSADTLFTRERLLTIGCVLCWYHDQGMIPVKLMAFDNAVNVTLGLPIMRFSPAHGVAYDLAGTGRARWHSFSRAMQLACCSHQSTRAAE